MRKLLLALPLLLLCSKAQAQVTAASCSQTDVLAAIASATGGQTVTVPAGSCTWTAVSLAKNITLNGAGQGVTNITLSGTSGVFAITKQVAGPTRIQNMSFTVLNNMSTPHAVTVGGPWPTGQPVIFYNLTINLTASDFCTVTTAGGAIFSHITQNGDYGSTLFTGKDVSNTSSWTTTSSEGTLDSTGFYNTYIEDNVFNGGGITDCDDACRVVLRHNICYTCTGFNSHGEDTSPQGMRQFEIYSNSFLYTNNAGVYQGNVCPGGSSTSPSNINQWVWIRGGTGVIYSNNFDSLYGPCWGDKAEVKMAIRGAEDARPQGACGSVSYPVPHQLGQGYNGSSTFLDPIYVWNNTSNVVSWAPGGVDPNASYHIEVSTGFEWGNPCGFNWNTFAQWGRDIINSTVGSPTLPSGGGSVDGIGGTAKAGYTAYTYPHPLAAGSSTPIINFSPLSSGAVQFGTVNVASTSAPVTVTISNVGSATETYTALGVLGGNASDWVKTGGTCATPSGTIATSASCTLIYTFTPGAQGARSTTLTMTGTVNSSVPFAGTGQTSISIPSVPTGLTATSPSGPSAILNWTASTGTVTGYKISRATVSGGPYTLIATTTNTLTTYTDSGLANNTYYYVVAAYNSAGTSANSTQASVTVNTQCTVNLFPPSLNFTGGIVGLISVAQTVTLTNTGSASCTSVNVANPSGPNGADFAQTNNCTSTVIVGGTCTISVTETPSTTATETASISVTSSDPLSPDTISLSGTATQGNVLVSPTSLGFGNIHTGKSSSTQTVTFTNNSGQIVTFSSVAITGGDSSQFTIDTNNCTSTLASGNSCTVILHFAPTSSGNKASTLAFTYTGTASVPAVTITGTGVGKRISKTL